MAKAMSASGRRSVDCIQTGNALMKIAKTTAALAACIVMALPVQADEVTLTAVSSLPATNDLMKSYFAFVDDVNENGKGVLQIDLRGGTEVIPRNEQMNAVSRGIVDLYFGPAGYFQRQIPELTPIDVASVPADKLRAAGLQDAIDAAARAQPTLDRRTAARRCAALSRPSAPSRRAVDCNPPARAAHQGSNCLVHTTSPSPPAGCAIRAAPAGRCARAPPPRRAARRPEPG